MRLAIVRQRYNPYGGAERIISRVLPTLEREGTEVTLITRRAEGWGARRVLRVDPFHIGNLWRDWSFARAARKAWRREAFDLVQSHERIPGCDVYRAGDGVHAQWLAERSRAQGPVARIATSLSPHHRYVLAAERALFTSPRLKAVICNSEMVRGEIGARFGTDPEKLVLIRNAVDAQAFHPGLRDEMRAAVRQQVKIPGDANVALHVGSGFERKGVAAMLAAVARSRAKPWALVVGRDKRASQYVALAGRLGISERVRFVGAVFDEVRRGGAPGRGRERLRARRARRRGHRLGPGPARGWCRAPRRRRGPGGRGALHARRHGTQVSRPLSAPASSIMSG